MSSEHSFELEVEEDIRGAERVRSVLREAANEIELVEYPRTTSLAERQDRLPRWPSGLGVAFDAIFDGFQGITVLGGNAGVGKSTLSMACALENAMSGALVMYCDAENAGGEQRERACRWFGGEPAFMQAQSKLAMNFNWTLIDNRHSWGTILLATEKRVMHTHKRALIVLDSMQTLADEIKPGNMLKVTADLYSRMNRIVRASAGRVSFLVLSELNKEGGVKGGAGQYRGTMVLRIVRDESMQGTDPEYRIEILKNRTGRTPGDVGAYTLDWWRCRFEPVKVS